MRSETGIPDAVVVGGGVIGLAVARELSREGARVTVLDGGEPGRGASWAAGGMLSPLGEKLQPLPFLELGRRSLALYPALAEGLKAETGIDVGYAATGKLEVAFSDGEADALARHPAREASGAARLLDRVELRSFEPQLAPEAVAGLWLPEDHAVDPRALVRALRESCAGSGVDLRAGTRVESLVTGGGAGSPRLEGLRVDGGTQIPAGAVVLAAGSWSGGLGGLPRPLPVHPVKGQMLSLGGAPPTDRVVATPRAYLIPRRDHLVVGATEEGVGFDGTLTAGGAARLLAGALEAFPGLAEVPIRERWMGFRPGTPDHLPILGPDPDLPGLFYATGHYRNGILLTPVTARILAGLVLGGDAGIPLAPFVVDREALRSPP